MLRPPSSELPLPDSLGRKLSSYRRRLWTIKLTEAVAAAVATIWIGFLLTFVLDRFHDTSPLIRSAILGAAAMGCLTIPLTLYRWLWRRRRPEQLARFLTQTQPAVGDQLLGVIELASDSDEQQRSPELVRAALAQAAEQVDSHDLLSAIPATQSRRRVLVAAALSVSAGVLWLVTPPAAANAWLRFVGPWKPLQRYTFAEVQPLPERLVVAADEPFAVAVELASTSRWRPHSATASLEPRFTAESKRADDGYRFEMPGQLSANVLSVRVGDYRDRIRIEPKPRPELRELSVRIELPAYLQRDQAVNREIRGSTVSMVRGSRAAVTVAGSRPLATATANGRPLIGDGNRFSLEPLVVDQPERLELQWTDRHGLTGLQPTTLDLQPIEDAPPTVATAGLPRQKVVLQSETLRFQVSADDDFGLQRVGIEWRVVSDDDRMETATDLPAGEYLLGAGGPLADHLELAAVFTAAELPVAGCRIAVRAFAEDFLPSRQRSYSSESEFDILSDDQHALWITDQLTRWQQQSRELRDRELQLHQANKALRDLPRDQLRQPENQDRIARQAELERLGGVQLQGLVNQGQRLLQDALRNPEIGVGHLDRWAEMIQTLQGIAANRMPTVAELLQQAASEPAASEPAPGNRAVGQSRLASAAHGGESQPGDALSPPAVPTITDVESSQLDLSNSAASQPSPSGAKASQLTLPDTMLASPPVPDPAGSPSPSTDKIEQAVEVQAELLAEFDKVADELNAVLENLEGSTFVKRLKASSRHQQRVAAQLTALAADTFGATDRTKDARADEFQTLTQEEIDSSAWVSHLMDDMDAYFQRSRLAGFGHVLEEMRAADVTVKLRQLGDELRDENGLAISQAEFWSDTLDRWAEDLVGACDGGQCPGAKAKGSLPPSVILEVMQILEGEINLREETRVAQQARPAVNDSEHLQTCENLSFSQEDLRKRTAEVSSSIRRLPEAEADFANELGMLDQVSDIMKETVEMLRDGDTGPAVIAAETEIIETMLKSKRFSPSGGGGATAPGGGGEGQTETPALALAGAGINAGEIRGETSASPSSGAGSVGLPAEYQRGLDAYFNRFEVWRSRR